MERRFEYLSHRGGMLAEWCLAVAIAHKEPGIGMVGAGVLRAPVQCFAEAFEAAKEW